MAVPIVLQKGQIVLTQTASLNDITFDNSPFTFGEVDSVSDLTNMYAVGDKVCYNPTGSYNFIYNGTDYVLTTEDKILFKETENHYNNA